MNRWSTPAWRQFAHESDSVRLTRWCFAQATRVRGLGLKAHLRFAVDVEAALLAAGMFQHALGTVAVVLLWGSPAEFLKHS